MDIELKIIVNDSLQPKESTFHYSIEFPLSSLKISIDVRLYNTIMNLYSRIYEQSKVKPELFFAESIRFLNAKQKWHYFTCKILNNPYYKIYLIYNRLLVLEKFKVEYKELLVKKLHQNISVDQLDRFNTLERLIPITILFQINEKLINEFKMINNWNISYLWSIAREIYCLNAGYRNCDYDKLRQKSVKLISFDEINKIISFNSSFEIRGNVEILKLLIYSEMKKLLLNIDFYNSNFLFQYKQRTIDEIRMELSIFNLKIDRYEDSNILSIINSKFPVKRNNEAFISFSYTKKLKNKSIKNNIFLNINDVNIYIHLKYLKTILQIFSHNYYPFFRKFHNDHDETATFISEYIIKLASSSQKGIRINIKLNKTALIFPCDKERVIIAQFDKIHVKTYESNKNMTFLPFMNGNHSKYNKGLVYSVIENFSIICTTTLIHRTMLNDNKFCKLSLEQSLLLPVTLKCVFLANKDKNTNNNFYYSTYINIDNFKFKISLDQIEVIYKIFSDAMEIFSLFDDKNINNKVIYCDSFQNSKNILDINIKINKISVGIRWNTFRCIQTVSHVNFMSEILFEIKSISGKVFINTNEKKFESKIESIIISHQIDNWIHTILCMRNEFFIKNITKINRNLKNYTKINIPIVELNLNYKSIQILIHFIKILHSIVFAKKSFNIDGKKKNNENKNLVASIKIKISDTKSHFMLKNNELFVVEISNLIGIIFNFSMDEYSSLIKFKKFILKDKSNPENLYNNIIEISRNSHITIKMNKIYSKIIEENNYNFKMEFSNIKFYFVCSSIETLKIWLKGLNEENIVLNHSKEYLNDNLSDILSSYNTKNKFNINIKILYPAVFIPVKSNISGGISVDLSVFECELNINIDKKTEIYKFNISSSNNIISRFLIKEKIFIFQKLIIIDSIKADIFIDKDDSLKIFKPLKIDIMSSDVFGSVLPEDILMLKDFLIHNFNEYSVLNKDKNYTFFQIYYGRLNRCTTYDSEILQLTFRAKTIKIKLLYCEDKIKKYYFESIEPHDEHHDLMEFNFEDMNIDFSYRLYTKIAKIFVGCFFINNLMSLNEELRNSSEQNIKKQFFISKSLVLSYKNFEKKSILEIILMESLCELNLYLIKYLKKHILPIFSDNDEYCSEDPRRSENSNFFNISFSNDFRKNRYERDYFFQLVINLKNTNVSYIPEVEDIFNQKFNAQFSSNFLLEIVNGIWEYKIDIADHIKIDVTSESFNKSTITRNLINLNEINVKFSITANFISNFDIVIREVKCHLWYKILKLAIDIKNKYISIEEKKYRSSTLSLMESFDNLNEINIFYPHSLSSYSRQLDMGYNESTIHLDLEVFVRYNDGFYYSGKIKTKFSSHLIVNIKSLNIDYEISTLDRLAVIPVISCRNTNILIYDFVLFKFKDDFKYMLGQVFDTINDKIVIRSYLNYKIEYVENKNIIKFPKMFLTNYRGIGLGIFCRYNDGRYYPAIICKRKSFQLEFKINISEKNKPVITHQIIDDSCCAFMWDTFDHKSYLCHGDNLLVITKIKNTYLGIPSRFYFEKNGFFLVKSFIDQKKIFVKPSCCIYLKPQTYGIKGLGSRYLYIYRDFVIPVIKERNDDLNYEYCSIDNEITFKAEFFDNLYVDIQPDNRIIYPYQTVLIDRTAGEARLFGNILTINADKTYKILLPDESCCSVKITDLMIKNPDVHIIKSSPISNIEQEGSLSIGNIKIFLVSEAYSEKKPLFYIDLSTSLNIYSWSKFENRLKISCDFYCAYLNTKLLHWEPFIQFLPIVTNKYKHNIRIKYTDSSLMDCSNLHEKTNIIESFPHNFKFYILDEINFTITEEFFRTCRILFDDINRESSELKLDKFFHTKFIFSNYTDIEMEIILTPESKCDKRILILKEMEKTELVLNSIDYDDIIENQKIAIPCMFQKIKNTDNKVFKFLNKPDITHYYFEHNSKIYSYIIEIKIFSRTYSIEFKYPFKIINLTEFPLLFHFYFQNLNKRVIKINENDDRSILLENSYDFDFSLSSSKNLKPKNSQIRISNKNFPLRCTYTLEKDDSTRLRLYCFVGYEDIKTCSSLQVKNSYKPINMIISPALTIKNDLECPLNILINFEHTEFKYVIKAGTEQYISHSSKNLNNFQIKFSLRLLGIIWEAIMECNMNLKYECVYLPFKPFQSNLVKNLGFTIEKSFCRKHLIRISSFYKLINKTNHNITFHFLKENLTIGDIIIIPAKSTLPFSLSHDSLKGNITIDGSLTSDTFPLKVIEFKTYLNMKIDIGVNLYHHIRVSIKTVTRKLTLIKFKSAVYFKNNLNLFIRMIPKNLKHDSSIFLGANKDKFSSIPLPLFPCDFLVYIDDFSSLYPIKYRTTLEKCTILFSPPHGKYFYGKSFWKNNLLNICFDEIKPDAFDYVLINFSKLTIYCHQEFKTLRLLPQEQIFFGKSCSDNFSSTTRFNFHAIIDRFHPTIDFEKQEENIKEIIVDKCKYYIAKFYDIRHTAFAITQDYNFALHCTDSISESVWLNLNLKISSLSFSIVSIKLSKELLVIYMFKNSNKWRKIDYDSNESIISSNEGRELDKLYIQYIKDKDSSVKYLGSKKQVDFKKMIYFDYKNKYRLEIIHSFAAYFTFNLSLSSEIQNLNMKIDKVQIDSPSFDSINQVVFCQTTKPSTLQMSNFSERNLLESSFFINRPFNYQILRNRKYQNIEYFKAKIQEFDICIDLSLILTLANYVDEICTIIFPLNFESKNKKTILKKNTNKYFIKVFHILPLKFNVNFISLSQNQSVNQLKRVGATNKLTYYDLIKCMFGGICLVDVSKTFIKIPSFKIENFNSLLTIEEIFKICKSHYALHIKTRFLKFLLNCSLLGNFVFCASQFTSGMESFVNEPLQAAVKWDAFGKGLIFGMRGLCYGTIGTVAYALSSMSDSVRKGVGYISFDNEYLNDRRKIMKLRQMDEVMGLEVTGLGLFKSIESGITGLVKSPAEAIKKSYGMTDIFKELGKGIVNFIAKPCGSILDFTSTGLYVIYKSTVDPDCCVQPRRQERSFYFDDIIRPINDEEIQKYFLFCIIKKNHNEIADDVFLWGELGSNFFHIISDRHLISATYHKLFETNLCFIAEISSKFMYEVVGKTIEFNEPIINDHKIIKYSERTFSFQFTSVEKIENFLELLTRFQSE